MATKNAPVHINLTTEVKEKLDTFCKQQESTRTSVVVKALEDFFNHRVGDYRVQLTLKRILDRRFSIPKQYSIPAFYCTLLLLASKYPKDSAKEFWGEAIYLSQANRTNSQIIADIKDELNVALRS